MIQIGTVFLQESNIRSVQFLPIIERLSKEQIDQLGYDPLKEYHPVAADIYLNEDIYTYPLGLEDGNRIISVRDKDDAVKLYEFCRSSCRNVCLILGAVDNEPKPLNELGFEFDVKEDK
jgi:hypothetical protein